MRITNSMITRNTKSNINSNKLLVDKYNTQMTTQKKISKASENPVIAIRSLRLSTTMSHINQYVDNNIPDASAWMDVTETALTNMISLLRDIRTQCVNGSTDANNADDRKIILDNLKSLAEQVYTEGNADYAGKSVFTGYRTSSTLTFEEDEVDTTYRIKQEFNFDVLEEKTLSGVRMALVAEKAGLFQSNIHYYYKSKYELLLAVQKKVLQHCIDLRKTLGEDDSTLDGQIETF